MDLDGKTALVTGGAAGIGAGIAERLAAEGMDVVIADLDQEAGAATAGRIGGSFVRADVATTAGVRAAVDAACQLAGLLGVLVSNAGGVEEPCFPTADPAKWSYTLDLNLRAVMLAAQLVLDPMAAGDGGAIITVASVAGLGTTSHDCPEYAAAKAGLIRFTSCLAPLRDSIGVRANCICPGLVDTPSSRRSRARLTTAQRKALPPALTPADIASAAMRFLADDSLAGRIMVCRGGEPSRLLPLVDWQTALRWDRDHGVTCRAGRRDGHRRVAGGAQALTRVPVEGLLPGRRRSLRPGRSRLVRRR
jgi:NAD(P)-dependent dehydrogenase (short-subunit alcohol dehydrogenase family)